MKNKNVLFGLCLLLVSSASTASCVKRMKLNYLKDTRVYICDDMTISHDQPSNTNYEGLCGPTAAANAFHAYCDQTIVDPKLISNKYFSDFTPGVRPDVMASGLNQMFSNNSECINGNWKYYYVTNRWDFLDSLYYEVRRGNGSLKRLISKSVKATRSPVIVLTKSSGKNLHWVTVVDIVGYRPGHMNSDYEKDTCNVIYNDSGTQTTITCESFVRRANGVDDSWYTDMILPEYVHLVFEPT